MKILMFEDEHYELLYPLTYLRPSFELRCGALSFRRKLQEKFPECELHLEVRDCLQDLAADMYGVGAVNNEERLKADQDVLLVNGTAILTSAAESYGDQQMVATTEEGELIWAYLRQEALQEYPVDSARELAAEALKNFAPHSTDDILVRYPWELVEHNPSQIVSDFEALSLGGTDVADREGIAFAGEPEDLHLGDDAQVEPWTYIDCRNGPVIVENGAVVGAHSTIEGPAWVGGDSHLFEARIRGGTSIGPTCRVGGEVEQSILHGFVNKYHTGFLGHSYLGEWVNLGASTNTSDLKNDYSPVRVHLNGEPVDTGLLKVGSFIGDHTKTGLNTQLNTGTVVGIMCNLVPGGRFPPKYVPSFSWYLLGNIRKGSGLAGALDTAREAMSRRGMELTGAMTELIKHTEKLTRPAKMQEVQKARRKSDR